MKYKPLNIKNVLLGKIGNIRNNLSKNKKITIGKISGYTLLKDLTPKYTSKKNRVGIYKSKEGGKVVIKRVNFIAENLDSFYLRNEAFVLKTLADSQNEEYFNNTSGRRIFPRFIDFVEEKNQVAFLTEFVDAKNLEQLDKKKREEIVVETYLKLRKLSKRLTDKNFYNLPIRKPFYYLLSFPLNLLRVIAKNPSKVWRYLKFGILFYNNYFGVIFGNYSLGLVHRDLYPDNILYNTKSKSITIIDWESAIVSDSLYDLSSIAMIYARDFGAKNMVNFLKENLADIPQKRRFIGLAIFNSIQILTNHKIDHPVFGQTEEFLDELSKDISPRVLYRKSLFEVINSFTLNLISAFYKFTKLSKINRKKRIVICYHSVGNTGWRFSTTIDDFANQISFLHKNYKLVPLQDLLSTKRGGVHLSFDDGYQDVLRNALPLLEKINVKATMFVLADYENANRDELDNVLPILDYQQIKFLHKIGWEIGSHTKTHANLGEATDSQLEDEIIAGKHDLEKKLGFRVRYFAYPKGIYTKKVLNYVKKAHFEAAFTVGGFDLGGTNRNHMEMGRICVDGQLSQDQFEALLSPFGLFISRIFMRVLIFKERITKKVKSNVNILLYNKINHTKKMPETKAIFTK